MNIRIILFTVLNATNNTDVWFKTVGNVVMFYKPPKISALEFAAGAIINSHSIPKSIKFETNLYAISIN